MRLVTNELQRLKLFAKLQIEDEIWHTSNECCTLPLSDNELDAIADCFENHSISETERSTLYYIAGYVSRKGGFVDNKESMEPLSDKGCEFTVQLSRGGLVHPSKDMFDLAQCLYSYYEKVCNKSCTKRLLVAFRLLQETIQCSYSDSVLRRFVNTFSKGFAKKRTEEIQSSKQKNTIKRKRLRNS